MRNTPLITEQKNSEGSLYAAVSTILRTTEVQISIVLIIIGLITVFAKDSISSTYFEMVQPPASSYSFSDVKYGFTNSNVSLENRLNLEHSLLMSLPSDIRETAKPYLKAILKISELYSLDPIWVSSVVWTESHFKPRANSPIGARGLMQLMPTTKAYIYKKLKKKKMYLIIEKPNFNLSEFFDFEISGNQKKYYSDRLVNLEIGIFYLKRLLKRFDGEHRIATIAYNMGPTWTRRKLRENYPLGSRNNYLAKVTRAYDHILKSI
jgi:soluble lytic murein transglycosylase